MKYKISIRSLKVLVGLLATVGLSLATDPVTTTDPPNSRPPQCGYIATPEMAIKISLVLIEHFYGQDWIKSQKPFKATLRGEYWLVEGAPVTEGSTGSVLYVKLSKKDGRVVTLTTR